MHTCINCGAHKATRDGNVFHCTACGYEWDVEFEQAMAHYLRAAGRRPAAPAAVQEVKSKARRRAKVKKEDDVRNGE